MHAQQRLSIEIPAEEHKKLKAIAALERTIMTELVLSSLRENVFGKIPNEETSKALDDTEKGKNLVRCNDIDDMFKQLGI